jgi:hypothetical protein
MIGDRRFAGERDSDRFSGLIFFELMEDERVQRRCFIGGAALGRGFGGDRRDGLRRQIQSFMCGRSVDRTVSERVT